MSLIITRKNGETLLVGDNVTIHIYGKGAVKMAIDAPKEVKILRGELAGKEQGRS